VLETVAGRCRVQQACARLGIGAARFQQVRAELLQAALASQEPRPPGRPALAPAAAAAQLAALQARVAELELELQAARAREEIALVLARGASGGESKKAAGRRLRRRRRPSSGSV
jgi:hypothetical protein